MALILVEAAVGVYVYVHKDTIKDTVSGNLKQWINEYHTPSQTSNAKAIIDKLQTGVSTFINVSATVLLGDITINQISTPAFLPCQCASDIICIFRQLI